MDKYFEINKNGQNIRCKMYYNRTDDIKKVILYGHGFAGHKDNGAAQKFADRVLSKYKGTAVLIFNMPCHGDDVKKKIILQDCMTYLDIVIDYIRNSLRAEEIYSYATSFGGYLVLKYINDYGSPFVKIALRCPAVDMYDVLTKTIMKEGQLDTILKGKNVLVGFDRKIEVNRQFLTDLQESDIRKYSYIDMADDLLIMHGTKDEVVPFADSRQFAEDNVIDFIPVENADHRFMDRSCMELATKETLSFFGM